MAADRSLMWPGAVLGVGLGALLDGILLHQILQWHHLISARVPPTSVEALEANTLADGLLHAIAWLVTVTGIALIVRAGASLEGQAAGRRLLGGIIIGWGAFNLLDAVINHHILVLHHVREGPAQTVYDVVFLVVAVATVAIGVAVHRSARRGVISEP